MTQQKNFRYAREAHSRQIYRVTSLACEFPRDISTSNLRAWDQFMNDELVFGETAGAVLSLENAEADYVVWLKYVLKSARALLVRCYIPCFDPIVLIRASLRKDAKNRCQASFKMPLLEGFRPDTFRNLFREATTIANFLNAHPPDFENREKLWSHMSHVSFQRIAMDNGVNSSTLHILYAAYKRGVPFLHLGQGVYQLGWGAAARRISASTTTDDSVLGNKLTGRKDVTASLLRKSGLPAPSHALVGTPAAALKAAELLGWPVVVKPADLERGEGVHVDVQPDKLCQAVETCLNVSPGRKALIEAQVSGVCHRLFIVQGRLLYAVKRLPIGVYGDGRTCIDQLVSAEIDAGLPFPAWTRSKIQPIDDLARDALMTQGMTETSVPEAGQFVALRRIETTAWGGVDEDVTDSVHPENLRAAVTATQLSGLSVAGVDIITEDISKPWTDTGAVINEVNYAPLLGGGDISRQKLPTYLDWILGGQCCIPVEVFAGDEAALSAAKTYVRTLGNKGVNAVLTSDIKTVDASGSEIPLAVSGLAARVRALIFSKSVEALAIVAQTDTLLDGPLPLEGVDRVHFLGELRVKGQDPKRGKRLMDLLSDWQWKTEGI